jgi:hypothetical protein
MFIESDGQVRSIVDRLIIHDNFSTLGRAGHLGKSISFFDPDRESDRTIAPDLIQKLSEVRNNYLIVIIHNMSIYERSRPPDQLSYE